jgi:acyl-[acyl carrier protein]--UDP-N-acetylglucosamine O-acyltransferase
MRRGFNNVRISEKAVVQTDNIGKDVTIHEFAVIRPGATLGNDVVIYPHVVIEREWSWRWSGSLPRAYLGKEPKDVELRLAPPTSKGY